MVSLELHVLYTSLLSLNELPLFPVAGTLFDSLASKSGCVPCDFLRVSSA